jgi:endonuclease/exonuclease/phosphatase family metal-dependent hydrolase
MSKTLRVLSSNIQAGATTRAYSEYVTRSWSQVLPNDKAENLTQLAQIYTHFDLLGLQECDVGSMRSGYANQVHFLAEQAEFAHSSHHATRRLSRFANSGNALLSKLAPTRIEHFVLPSRIPGRGVIVAQFNKGEHVWHVAITHLSLMAKTRVAQIAFLSEMLADKKHLLLMGDFNCQANAPEMQRLFLNTHLQMPNEMPNTFPSWKPKRAIDHIFAAGFQTSNYRTVPAAGSDHLAIALDVHLDFSNT